MHACWDDDALSRIVQLGAERLRAAFDHFESAVARELLELGLLERSEAEQREYDLKSREPTRERELNLPEGGCVRLGALRWPEREPVFDTGDRLATE
ncbi:MAG TPA: hypothetical protein VIN61_04945 [Gammaproteobacteria bacterium]